MKGAREKARITKAQNELAAYRTALMLYEDKYEYEYSPTTCGAGDGKGWAKDCLNPPLESEGYSSFPEKNLKIVKERGEPHQTGRAAKSRGLAFAACGGEKCSNYFQYSPLSKNLSEVN